MSGRLVAWAAASERDGGFTERLYQTRHIDAEAPTTSRGLNQFWMFDT